LHALAEEYLLAGIFKATHVNHLRNIGEVLNRFNLVFLRIVAVMHFIEITAFKRDDIRVLASTLVILDQQGLLDELAYRLTNLSNVRFV